MRMAEAYDQIADVPHALVAVELLIHAGMGAPDACRFAASRMAHNDLAVVALDVAYYPRDHGAEQLRAGCADA